MAYTPLISAAQLSILDTLASQLGIEHRFSLASGYAQSDVNGWLTYALADSVQSTGIATVRARVKLLLGTNQTPKAKELFEYYYSLLNFGLVPIVGLTTIGVAQNSWRWDALGFTLSGSNPNQYVATTEQMARYRLLIPDGCTYVDVEAVATSGVGAVLGNTVDVVINSATVSNGSLAFGATPLVKQTIRCLVPGSGNRLLELYEQGCYITALTPQTAMTLATPGPPRNSCVYIGASGTQGYFAWDPTNFTAGVLQFILSWVGRMKTLQRFAQSFVIATSGYGLTSYGVVDAATAAAFAASTVIPHCTGTSERVAYLEFGAGEQLNNASTPTVFAQNLTYLVDAIHTLDPTVRIELQTPVVISSPSEATANGLGFTMQNYRDAIAGVQAARSSFCTLVKGYNGGAADAMTTSTGDLQDGKHLTPVAMRDKAYPYAASVV